MSNYLPPALCCALAIVTSHFSIAATLEKQAPIRGGGSVNINNGIIGDGAWNVTVLQGGNTDDGTLDPLGPIAASDLIFDFITYFDVGANGGGVALDDSTATQPVLGLDNTVNSTGQFTGNNAEIFWSAAARIAPGTQSYQVTLNFTSIQAFGVVRLINYLDEDVLGPADDSLILLNSVASPNFQLLTIDNTDSVGIAHSAGYTNATNASYIGWAASRFPNLRDAIQSAAGAQFSIAGVVNTVDFPSTVDPRFPFSTAYGPSDATAAFAFDLNPNASSATITFALGSQPNVQNDAIFRNGFE